MRTPYIRHAPPRHIIALMVVLTEPPFDQYHEGGPEQLFGQAADRIIEFVRHTNALSLAPAGASFKESVCSPSRRFYV